MIFIDSPTKLRLGRDYSNLQLLRGRSVLVPLISYTYAIVDNIYSLLWLYRY